MKIKNLVIFSLFCLITGGWEVFLTQAHGMGNFETGIKPVRMQDISSFIQQAMLTASDGETYDWFGVSVAVSGDTVAVGAHGDDVDGNFNQGAVYVFQFEDGIWVQQAMLTASDGSPNSYLGQEVVMNENIIVASAANEVYVYDKPTSGWITTTETTRIFPPDAGPSDFGLTMALQENTLVIGAPYSTVNSNDAQGAVYVYEYQAEQWEQTAKLTASDGAAEDRFGYVDMNGDTIVAGAGDKDVGSNPDQGAAYVFVEPPTGWITGTEIAILTASDGEMEDYFGFAVSIYTDTIVMGSFNDDVGTNLGQGSAYIFVEPAGGWVTTTETAKLVASDGAEFDYFGISVESGDGQVMIGATYADINSNLAQGAVYVFYGSGSVWIEHEKLTAYDGGGDGNDFFGQSISFDGNSLLIGAHWSDIGANMSQGAAYVFADVIPATPTPTMTNIPTPTQTPTATNIPANTPTPTPTITPTPRNPLFCPIVVRE